MPTHNVTFQPAGLTVAVDPARYPFGGDGEPGSILDIALAHGVEIAHACAGAGVCGTCHVIVEEGMAHLSEATDDELDTVEQQAGNTPQSRLACQAVVNGDVTVRIP